MHDRAYITIVKWPSGFTREDRALVLVDALGMDPYLASQKANHATPLVIARTDAHTAPDVVARFRARRVSAFALTQAYLRSQPRPFLVKRLVPALGCEDPMYLVEAWRGDASGLRTRDIFLIVRAAIDRTRTKVEIDRGADLRHADDTFGDNSFAHVVRSSTHEATHIIDVYLHDGSRFRFNADRLSFDVLGKERGLTDIENTDKLALRLASEAPQALIDTGFRQFRIPPDLARDLISVFGEFAEVRVDEAAAFEFYSVWSHTIHRGLARANAPATE